MKKLIIGLLLSVFASGVFAQTDTTKYWTIKGKNSLNFSQVSFSHWSAGGENSISLNALIDYSANYKKGDFSWDNNMILGYGLTRQGDSKIKKSDDRIDLSTKCGWKAAKHWNVSAFLGFKTQFTQGFKYPERDVISDFMAPAYIVGGIGMDYKPCDYFSVLITPISGKMTIVNDDDLIETFGIDEGKNTRTEFGASLKAVFDKEIFTNVNLKSKLELFSNYLKNTKNIDVLWDVNLNMKINSFLSTNFVVNMIYDDDVKTVEDDGTTSGANIQYMQLFGLGLTYNF